MRYLFDTSALIAFFSAEEGHERVKTLLDKVESRLADGFVSTITLTELLYLFGARDGSIGARKVVETVMESRLTVLTIDVSTSLLAGEYKRKSIPLADALIAANASEVGAVVVTDDPHFSKVGIETHQFR